MRQFISGLNEINNPDLLKFLNIKLIGLHTSSDQLPESDFETYSELILDEKQDKLKPGSLKQKLSKNRLKYDIIVVRAFTAKIAALAARDGRVDAILLSDRSTVKVFNRRFARRLQENNKLIYLDVSNFIGSIRASTIRPYLRILQSMEGIPLHFILVNYTLNELDFRPYRGLQSIARLLNLSPSNTDIQPLYDRIQLNRKKISGKIPFVGIEIIEEED